MSTLKLITITLILIFVAIAINIEVARLRIENRELLEKINSLEEERAYYEDTLFKRITLSELEKKAKEIGLQYPKDILKIKISKGYIVESKMEKYFATSYKDYFFNNKP